MAEAHISESIMQSSSPLAGRDAKVLVEEAQSELLSAQQSVRPISQDFSMTIKKKKKNTSRIKTNEQTNKQTKRSAIHSLDASKPPEGAGVPLAGSGAAAAATAAAEASRGAVGDGRVPRVSKPVSRRSFCTGAGVRDGATVGARVRDISPEGGGATHFTVTLTFVVHFSRCVSM